MSGNLWPFRPKVCFAPLAQRYYCDTFLVADYRQIEARLKDLLGRFRDKKGKEIYILHYTNLNYIIKYLCEHYNEEVDEVNAKLTEFISNLHPQRLRPVIPEACNIQFANITTLEEDGTVTNTTFHTTSEKEFKDKLENYISKLSATTTELVKKKVFDDLNVKKERTKKLPILREVLGRLRPNIKLKLKE